MVVVNKSEKCKLESQQGHFLACDNRGMLNLNQELVINKGDINTLYRMDKGAPFATGLYAQVKRCKSLTNNGYYAAKFCPRKRPGQSSDEECIENLHEIALLSQLKHPYIISFTDAFILKDCVVTIMELAPGGDLQTVIDADLVLLEKDASRYIFQLLEALKYLHERYIAHLDIKPQNLLLMGEFPTCEIKLCDFEISRVIKPGKEVKEILGTPDYVAPEILLYEPLTTFADMWSVGILAYVLLTGFSPFGGDTDQETFRNIVHEPIDFPDELFEDISPSAIDFILKLTVKSAKLRPTSNEMEKHEWLKEVVSEVQTTPIEIDIPSEPEIVETNISINHTGPKKRSPRKTMALSGRSTASTAAGRRPSARTILRACKSAYDLNKMGGKTKSREALIEKMKIASGGDSGVSGNWKLRKNLSKSREQLWESKIQLSKSCERINNNFGTARWASVANFPSLGAMKSSTSQESVISVISTCTNAGSGITQQDILLDWQQQSLDDFSYPIPQNYSASMPNTPPIPNFDLTSPANNISMAINHDVGLGLNVNHNCQPHPAPDFDYPSLVNGTCQAEEASGENASSANTPLSAVEQESQKSVAELIATFGGRGAAAAAAAAIAKKLDLKNQFEPILEVDGSEEQPISLGDCSDNNSTSGVSSILGMTPGTKSSEPKSAESGNYSMNSSSSSETTHEHNSRTNTATLDNLVRKNSRVIKTPANPNLRRVSPPKIHHDGNSGGLKGILKKSTFSTPSPNSADSICSYSNNNGINLSRRGSIPGNCTRLYDSHTISSLAKVPKKSILKNSQQQQQHANHNEVKSRSSSLDITTSSFRRTSGDRSLPFIKPSENNNCTDLEQSSKSGPSSDVISKMGNKNKIIPKGLSPRERPSFILLSDVKPKPRKVGPPPKTTQPAQPRPNRKPVVTRPRSTTTPLPSPSTRPPPKPRTSIREQILQKRLPQKQNKTLTVNILTKPNPNAKKSTPPGSPTDETDNKSLINSKNSKFKSELTIEPAAIKIKIFPPDPAIVPKSPTISESKNIDEYNNCNNNNNDKNNNNDIILSSSDKESSINSLVSSINLVNLEEPKSPEGQEVKSKNGHGIKSNKLDPFERSTWGVICTGSIGRAMRGFETGTRKLRRGSVPDF